MGKKATFERAHQRQLRHTREQRDRKTAAVRATRRGEDSTVRLIQRTTPTRAIVSDEKKIMLVEQFAQACRLPATCEDLCTLLRQAGGEETQDVDVSRKRPRENSEKDESVLSSIVDAFLQLENQAVTTADEGNDNNNDDNNNNNNNNNNNGEEPVSLLEDVIQNECGGRVVCALISAVDTCKYEKKFSVLDAVTKLFEENETLYGHFVACKVMSSLVQHGDRSIQKRILQVLRHHAVTAEQLQGQLRNRHSSVTIQHLLEHFPTETAAWIGDTLGITKCDGKTNKEKEEEKQEELISLILDPVASPVVRAFFLRSNSRLSFMKSIDISKLLESKRGCKFLQEALLSSELQKWSSDEAIEVLDVVMPLCEDKIVEMCTSSDANFVVQAIFELISHTGETVANERFKRLLHLLGPHLTSLMTHHIGVHVVVHLIVKTITLTTKSIVEEIATTLITRNNVVDMLRDSNGSLVVRKLLPLCKVKNSKIGQLLTITFEKDMTSLIYDSIGNLTAQEYIKVCGAEELARKLIKNDELLTMSQHPYASHVIGCLFDHVGASTHTSLCNALRPHVVNLSTHLNGRFVVEKVIHTNRDICDLLLREFTALACEKGTQHVLCTLVANLDQRGRQKVISTVISGLYNLATQQCSSVVLQKLMQTDTSVLQAVKEELSRKPHLRNNLAQNFFGKFVVQISEGSGN
ncbi:pumilio-repeat, RNA-binding protein [Trypanosoma theileri]|uniref:Pumilio-repeat, RNA-binding protein n=1 Tax=Trypanosoma theileri TaxID=67003 RepID=A0A1X0NV47_9TRYP|nr:pumilio-repeat, RNA-binding protein [Trypanosoma theileri]ORC88567.1 pumilio-repeat, RNA-binding protein [Trypanosoma theileri]